MHDLMPDDPTEDLPSDDLWEAHAGWWIEGFTEGADSDLTDAELRTAARHRSTRQLPTYAKRTRKQLISGSKKRREERMKLTLLLQQPAACSNNDPTNAPNY